MATAGCETGEDRRCLSFQQPAGHLNRKLAVTSLGYIVQDPATSPRQQEVRWQRTRQ